MKRAELKQLIKETYQGILKEDQLVDLLADIKDADELGSPKRRQIISDLVALFKNVNLSDIKNLQLKLFDVIKNPKYTEIIMDILKTLNELDEESLKSVMKLSEKLNNFISTDRLSVDQKRHFIDLIQIHLGNFSDNEILKIYNAEKKLWYLLELNK